MTLQDLTPERAEAFRAVLPEDRFDLPSAQYLEEPRGRWAGAGGLLARPRAADEVAALVRVASAEGIGIVPYGGGTGLVGGQVSQDGPRCLILSLERMTGLRDVLPEENILVAEAGAILADVQGAADEVGRLFPLSLASEGSARIGGLLSTNAGGTGVLRYGNARDLCLGIEAVLPNGEILRGLKRLRKDNTGYDLRHLLLGAEGTLGIITAAALKLSPQPAVTGVALMAVRDPAAALTLLALELIHRQGFDFLAETGVAVRNPWEVTPDWCVLIEVGLAEGLVAEDGLAALFVDAQEAGLVSDGLVAQSAQQGQDFWAIRERIPEANRLVGSVSSHDISVPLGAIPEFIAEGGTRIAAVGDFRINCFGHVGDGNLHYNVFPRRGGTRQDHLAERDEIKRVVHDLAHELGGSVSAEHGIGRLKVDDLERYGDPTKLAAMRAIKQALDPRGIMNPGAVLRM